MYASKVPETAIEGDPGAFYGVVNMVINAITEEKVAKLNHSESELESMILSVLNESLLDDKQFNLSFTRDDAKEFVQAIQEEIKKYALRLAGKDKCVWFSPKVIRIAMALWLRSPAAYEELRQSNWIMSLPSQDALRKIQHNMKVEEGQSVLLYTHHRAHSMLMRTTTEGNISCDEMKLIENIIWNTHSQCVDGFCGDFLDLGSVLRRQRKNQPSKSICGGIARLM
jgi:predicted NodU family carbamoyl transferase